MVEEEPPGDLRRGRGGSEGREEREGAKGFGFGRRRAGRIGELGFSTATRLLYCLRVILTIGLPMNGQE